MRRLFSYLMKNYQEKDYVLQLKAKFLIRLHLVLIPLMVVVIVYTAYLQLYNPLFDNRLNPPIILTELATLILLAAVFCLLVKGYFAVSAHLTMIVGMAGVWLVLILGELAPVARLDSIVLLMPLLAMLPLISNRSRRSIVLYTGINVVVLFLFVYFCREQLDVPDGSLIDYLADNTVGFVLIGVVAYQVFSISQKALDKAEIDIQERKLAEEKASNSRRFLESSLASAPMGVLLLDENERLSYANPAFLNRVGRSKEEFVGKPLQEIMPPPMSPAFLAEMEEKTRKQLAVGKPVYQEEIEVQDDGGNPFYVAYSAATIEDEQDNQLGAVVFISDITERKLAEIELRQLRNYLKNIIDSMPSMIMGVDRVGRVTQWNIETRKSTGISSEEAMGKELSEVFPRMSDEMDKIRRAIDDHQPQKHEKVAEVDGESRRYSDVTIYPLTSNGVEGAVVRIDDVTDRVRMEEMMIQSEKMLSVGGLAAGMAHEINNPLAGIIQNVQVVRNRLRKGLEKNRQTAEESGTTLEAIEDYLNRREIFKMIDSIMESGRHAAEIVDNMLSFSRKSESTKSPQDLGRLLDRTVELASQDYDLKNKYDFRKIEILREYDPSVPEVPCEASKIQQAFLNILTNGSQAMANNGKEGVPHRFNLRIVPEADMARVEIEDNGPGMDEETRVRAFEPFFTTKEVGLGTGLGLFISYFIVTENHEGTIAIESVPGRGTKFVVRLPLSG
ncbi:MAG: PAS domain S-box protein [Proteobacteria bacterium]|nr:PAS domain S-box protein [Pseudomonadota bacterium]